MQKDGRVVESFVTRNVFAALKDYHRISYTHNAWAYTLLRQFQRQIDELVPRSKLFLAPFDSLIETLFSNDQDIASVSWIRDVHTKRDGYGYSLLLSHLYEALQGKQDRELGHMFPRGIPSTGDVGSEYLLETAIDWTSQRAPTLAQPFLAYFHFLPPHEPYHTSQEFYNRFKGDSFTPPNKPVDILAHKNGPNAMESRREYDEYVLYVDQQFGRFYDALEASGLLDKTWLVFTSDHGEMLERGIVGHVTEVLYQPVVRIPLLIFEPGRAAGIDIHTSTSAVDLLPTLAQLTGHAIPDWAEGVVLPPFATTAPDPGRSIYAVQARTTAQNEPLTEASTILVKGRYKLHYYFGYSGLGADELAKLYDVEADPEELVDLSASQTDVTAELLAELKSKLAQVNKPYQA
jgi:arylsulfatase A-like enzyme